MAVELKPTSGRVVAVPRLLDRESGLTNVRCRWREGAAGRIYLLCPDCGRELWLNDRSPGRLHIIDCEGLVHPSVSCRQCGWHEFVRLEGWDG